MTLTKRTVLDQIEVRPDDTLQIRLALQVVDGETVEKSAWHRTIIPAGHPVDAQMDEVDRHLKSMGYPALPKAHREKIKKHAAI